MKRSLIIALVAVVLFQSNSLLCVVGAFYLNRQYISENLCVERNEAVTMCYGSCYLEEQVTRTQEKEQELPDIKVKEVTLFCDIRELNRPVPLQQEHGSPVPVSRPEFYRFNYSAAVFHPPAAFFV